MRPVVSLHAHRTLTGIQVELEETGQAQCDVRELTVDVDEWRALARRAARNLGRLVETIATNDRVVAHLKDWPRDDEERAITLARLRRTIDAMQEPPRDDS